MVDIQLWKCVNGKRLRTTFAAERNLGAFYGSGKVSDDPYQSSNCWWTLGEGAWLEVQEWLHTLSGHASLDSLTGLLDNCLISRHVLSNIPWYPESFHILRIYVIKLRCLTAKSSPTGLLVHKDPSLNIQGIVLSIPDIAKHRLHVCLSLLSLSRFSTKCVLLTVKSLHCWQDLASEALIGESGDVAVPTCSMQQLQCIRLLKKLSHLKEICILNDGRFISASPHI